MLDTRFFVQTRIEMREVTSPVTIDFFSFDECDIIRHVHTGVACFSLFLPLVDYHRGEHEKAVYIEPVDIIDRFCLLADGQ